MAQSSVVINAKKLSFIGKASGLMFRRQSVYNMLFEFKQEGLYVIHSYFVFFPFLALWLDSNNQIIECRIIKPFTFRAIPRRRFKKLIEIPLNKKNESLIKFLVGKGKDLNRISIRDKY